MRPEVLHFKELHGGTSAAGKTKIKRNVIFLIFNPFLKVEKKSLLLLFSFFDCEINFTK